MGNLHENYGVTLDYFLLITEVGNLDTCAKPKQRKCYNVKTQIFSRTKPGCAYPACAVYRDSEFLESMTFLYFYSSIMLEILNF